MKIEGITPSKQQEQDLASQFKDEVMDVPSFEIEEAEEDEYDLEEDETTTEEALKKYQAEQIKAAKLKSYVTPDGKFKVSFVLEDGTKVVMKTLTGKDIRAQNRVRKKNPHMTETDLSFHAIMLQIESWGENNSVTLAELDEVSDSDFFRIGKGIERIQTRKGL